MLSFDCSCCCLSYVFFKDSFFPKAFRLCMSEQSEQKKASKTIANSCVAHHVRKLGYVQIAIAISAAALDSRWWSPKKCDQRYVYVQSALGFVDASYFHRLAKLLDDGGWEQSQEQQHQPLKSMNFNVFFLHRGCWCGGLIQFFTFSACLVGLNYAQNKI